MAHLSHLFMLVSDLAAAKAFYIDALGLELLEDHGGYIRIGGGDGFHIGMEEGPPERIGSPGIEINLWVDDCDATIERLAEAGLDIAEWPSTAEWGARYGAVVDHDGYRIGIQSASR